jgi:hypothetical protein
MVLPPIVQLQNLAYLLLPESFHQLDAYADNSRLIRPFFFGGVCAVAIDY